MRLPARSSASSLAACGTTYEVPVAGGAVPRSPAPGVAGGAARTAARLRPRRRPRRAGGGGASAARRCPGAPAGYCDFRIAPRHRPADAAERLPDPRRGRAPGGGGRRRRSSPRCAPTTRSPSCSATRWATRSPATSRKQQQQQVLGALILGGLVAAAGDAYGGVASRRRDPAGDGRRRLRRRAAAYSQSYELEADTLGAYIAARAGYDPERGAAIFERPALANPGGPPILASHPGSAQRQADVARGRRRDPPPAGARPGPDPPGRGSRVRNFPRRCFLGLRVTAADPRYPLTETDGATRRSRTRR